MVSKKKIKGLSHTKTIIEKVKSEDCISILVREVIKTIEYNIRVSISMKKDKFVIEVKELSKEKKLVLNDISKYDVRKNIFIPGIYRIGKKVDIEVDTKETINMDFRLLEESYIILNEVRNLNGNIIRYSFKLEDLRDEFKTYIGNEKKVRYDLQKNFEKAMKESKIEIRINNKILSELNEKSNLIEKEIANDGIGKTKIEIRRNKEKGKFVNIYANDILIVRDSGERYVNWKKKPYKQNGYTFVRLIINTCRYENNMNLNEINLKDEKSGLDINIFKKVKGEVENLIDKNKNIFINLDVNINFEEKKSELDKIMNGTGETSYTRFVIRIIRAIIKSEENNEKIMEKLKKYF